MIETILLLMKSCEKFDLLFMHIQCATTCSLEKVNFKVYTAVSKELHCVSKNDSDVAQYNFNTHQPILVIFGRDIAERICY